MSSRPIKTNVPHILMIAVVALLTACGGGGVVDAVPGNTGGGSSSTLPEPFDTGVSYTQELYVQAGAVGGNGSAAMPFGTIQQAAAVVTGGTRIHVAAGTYVGPIFLTNVSGTSTAAPIAIVGEPGAIIDGGGSNAFTVSQSRFLVIEGLTFRNSLNTLLVLDDGGDVNNAEALDHIALRNLVFLAHNNSPATRCLQLAGANNFWVLDSDFSGCASIQALQVVGGHSGVIHGNRIHDMTLSGGGLQLRGGSRAIMIHGNRFANLGVDAFAIKAGGSTDFAFFRPPIQPAPAVNTEAAQILMEANVVSSVGTAVSFTGCDDCSFTNNTVIDPTRWVSRILQETFSDATYTFEPCRNGRFVNNIVRYRTADIPSGYQIVNISAGTDPATFEYGNNLWWATDQGAGYVTLLRPEIAAETASLHQLDPGFANSAAGDFHIDATSPAAGRGRAVSDSSGMDFDGIDYRNPRSIGAFDVP